MGTALGCCAVRQVDVSSGLTQDPMCTFAGCHDPDVPQVWAPNFYGFSMDSKGTRLHCFQIGIDKAFCNN